MIYGIGTDIISIARVQKVMLRHGERFAERILTIEELSELKHKRNPERFLAKRFAAKEAFSKAIGLGMRMPMAWRNMGVGHDKHGKPLIVCNPGLQAYMESVGIGTGHISITDEQDYAVAFVILEKA